MEYKVIMKREGDKLNRKNLKRLAFIITIAFLILISSKADAVVIERLTEKNHIAPGVTHERVRTFFTNGWQNVNILRIDVNNPYSEIRGIYNPQGLTKRATVTNMVNQNGAVAGINGDYFEYSPVAQSIGGMVSKGELVTSPIEPADYSTPVFQIGKNGQTAVDYLDKHLTVTNNTKNVSLSIHTFNRVPHGFKTIAMLDRKFSNTSLGSRYGSDMVEVIVDGDTVTDVRVGQGPANIPQNGYVLLARGHEVLKSFQVGDKLTKDVKVLPKIGDLDFAISGGSIILKDGVPTVTNIHSSGIHPRTGIGVNQSGSEIIMITIDGRNEFRGIGQKEFGQLMKEFGAYNALNLDGGGSTAMVVKTEKDTSAKLVNKPSDGGERQVVNGVGVFKLPAPVESLNSIELSFDDDNVFNNTHRTFSAKGYDRNRNEIKLDQSRLQAYITKGSGEIVNNSVRPNGIGVLELTVEYDGFKDTKEIQILGEITHLKAPVERLNLNLGQSQWLYALEGYDTSGQKAKIEARDIYYETTGDIGVVEGNNLIGASMPAGGYLIGQRDKGRVNIPVSVAGGPITTEVKEGSQLMDLQNRKAELETGGYKLAVITSTNLDGKGSSPKPGPRKVSNNPVYVNGKRVNLTLPIYIQDNSTYIPLRELVSVSGGSVDYDSENRIAKTEYKGNKVEFRLNSKEYWVNGTKGRLPGTQMAFVAENYTFVPFRIALENLGYKVDYRAEDRSIHISPGDGKKVVMEAGHIKVDLIDDLIKASNDYNNLILLGGMKDIHANRINGNKIYGHNDFQVKDLQGITVITLNTSKGGLRTSDSSQWPKLKDALNNAQEDIIITTTRPLFGSDGYTDKLEADLLAKYLSDTRAKGKNVFFVQGGNYNKVDLKDGVRYIHLKTNGPQNDGEIYQIPLLEFIKNPSGLTYNIEYLWKE